MKKSLTAALMACAMVLGTGAVSGAQIRIDHTSTDLSQIPAAFITQAKSNLHIAYQHTSHGSQLITGMNTLMSFASYGDTYGWSDEGAAGTLDLDDNGIPGCQDLSQGDSIDIYGVTPWVTATRNLLDNPANSHVNVVVWSWCSINGHDAQRYVDNMEILISEYPSVQFVFMTGHAEGQGEDLTPDSVHYNNQLIRQHCADNSRILFDFADIEAYNPDGEYFWDRDLEDNLDYSGGNWAVEWLAANPGSELGQLTAGCSGCAHSDTPTQANLNCVLKGRAAWWLWARLAGWSGTGDATTTTSASSTTTTVAAPCPFTKVLGRGNPGLEKLRSLRDSTLAASAQGRRLIRLYYGHAGSINDALDRSPVLRAAARRALEAVAAMVDDPRT